MKKKQVAICCMLLCIIINVRGIIIGSLTLPSIQGAVTFLSSDSDNEIRGFGVFSSGFSLENSSTTCTFNSAYPVLGNVSLNGGRLYCAQDLIFKSPIELDSGGIFQASSAAISFPNVRALTLPASSIHPLVFQGANVDINSTVTLNSFVYCSQSCVIDAHNNIIDLNLQSIVIEPDTTFTIKNAVIRGIQEHSIMPLASSSSITFDNTRLCFDDDCTFSLGKYYVDGNVLLSGSGAFKYRSNDGMTINRHSILTVDTGVTFSYAPTIANNNLLVFSDQTSLFCLSNATLCSSATGLHLTKGTLVIDGRVKIQSDAVVESEAVVFGDGSISANDMKVEIMPDAGIELESGVIANRNVA